MQQRTSGERVWPYVLPFPLDPESRKLIWSILQSRVGLEILGSINFESQTYHQDLIEKLPYSNKSIIKYLKKMVKAAILEQGMRVSTEKRSVWVKWYKPTNFGKWIILFLKSPKEVPLGVTKTAIEELFHLYSASIVEVCQKYDLEIDLFHRDLNRQYLSELAKEQPEITPKVTVFGSIALDIYGEIERLPSSDEVVYVEETDRYAGGMGANVAIALAKLNVPVAFSGRIGSDSVGRMLLENLIRNNVDVSSVHPVDAASLQTLVLSAKHEHRWLFAIGSSQSAISLTEPEEINWEKLKPCEVIYIGEVFVEIASAIADYANTRSKTVLYRPGAPYMKFGVEKLESVLEHTDIFILNQTSWSQLQGASEVEMQTPADLLEYGVESVILTKGAEGCEIFSEESHEEFPVKPQLRAKFKTVDSTGAGDGFSAGLIKGLLDNQSLERSVIYGQVAAAITCSRVGASVASPSEQELQEEANKCQQK